MPTLIRLTRSRIEMYYGDHPPPHFHVIAGKDRAMIDILTLEVLAGKVPAQALKEARGWASANRDLLHAKWTEFNEEE